MQIREYQALAIEQANEALSRERSCLIVMPTGTGKTIFFAFLANDFVMGGGRVLIMAHRGELLNQARDKIQKTIGLGCAIEKAQESCLQDFSSIVVGSVQSLKSEKRLSLFPTDYFSHIVIDEAHHATSKSYQSVIHHFKDAKIIGVTATPDRSDNESLGKVFKELAYEYTLPQAIMEGYLVPISVQTIPIKLDISGVSIERGDFRASEIDDLITPYMEAIADEMVTYCRDRKTVVFLPLIETSKKFQSILQTRGFETFEVNGTSKDRAEVLDAFERAGKNTVMCNSMLLTEGWDCETVDCVICLRPTKSRPLYTQIIGRGTRPTVAHEISKLGLTPDQRQEIIKQSEKKYLLLLDFMWHLGRHELCRPANLTCADDDVARELTKQIEEKGTEIDITDAEVIEDAEKEVDNQREASMAKAIKEAEKKKKTLVNPLEYEMTIGTQDLRDYKPTQVWEHAPVSAKQKKLLESLSIYAESVPNAGKAEKLIEVANKRKADGMATPKQMRMLEKRYHFEGVKDWSFTDANKMISRISSNGWRVPPGVKPSEYKPKPQPALPEFGFNTGIKA